MLVVLFLLVAFTATLFFVRGLFQNILNQLYGALGLSGFSWDYVPEPYRGIARAVDEQVLPYAFLIGAALAVILEIVYMWRATREGYAR